MLLSTLVSLHPWSPRLPRFNLRPCPTSTHRVNRPPSPRAHAGTTAMSPSRRRSNELGESSTSISRPHLAARATQPGVRSALASSHRFVKC
eukprot:910386-Pleurochrysis_carterae.AAC.1